MSSLMDEATKLIGSRISIKNDDYGTVTEVVSVIKNDVTYIVVVTDKGKRVEARSLLNNLTSSTKGKVYPDGTAYSKRFAGPKVPYRATPALVANISNTARIGVYSINLTSHLSSHDNCAEDVADKKVDANG
jgi:hypothetical protein